MSSTPPLTIGTPAVIAAYESECRRIAAELQVLNQESENWKLIDETTGVKIFHKLGVGDEKSVFKGVGIIQAPIHVCMELLMDTSKKSQYDSIFDKAVVIEELTAHIKVEHQCYWAPFPVSKRDFCMMLNKARFEDGTVCLLGKSVTHPQVPERSNYVRGEVTLGGWILQAIVDPVTQESKSTRVTFIGCSDLKGSIPAVIKKQLDRKQPGLVNSIKPLLAKRVDELEKMKDAADKQATIDKMKNLIHVLPTYTNQELAEARQMAKDVKMIEGLTSS